MYIYIYNIYICIYICIYKLERGTGAEVTDAEHGVDNGREGLQRCRRLVHLREEDACMSYEEEDTCM